MAEPRNWPWVVTSKSCRPPTSTSTSKKPAREAAAKRCGKGGCERSVSVLVGRCCCISSLKHPPPTQTPPSFPNTHQSLRKLCRRQAASGAMAPLVTWWPSNVTGTRLNNSTTTECTAGVMGVAATCSAASAAAVAPWHSAQCTAASEAPQDPQPPCRRHQQGTHPARRQRASQRSCHCKCHPTSAGHVDWVHGRVTVMLG